MSAREVQQGNTTTAHLAHFHSFAAGVAYRSMWGSYQARYVWSLGCGYYTRCEWSAGGDTSCEDLT